MDKDRMLQFTVIYLEMSQCSLKFCVIKAVSRYAHTKCVSDHTAVSTSLGCCFTYFFCYNL